MLDPALFADTPFGNSTALLDYFGLEAMYHRELAKSVFALSGVTYRTYPLGDGGAQRWLEAHQQELVSAATALGIPAPVDLANYDLRDPTDFASYFFLSSLEHRRIGRAAALL